METRLIYKPEKPSRGVTISNHFRTHLAVDFLLTSVSQRQVDAVQRHPIDFLLPAIKGPPDLQADEGEKSQIKIATSLYPNYRFQNNCLALMRTPSSKQKMRSCVLSFLDLAFFFSSLTAE